MQYLPCFTSFSCGSLYCSSQILQFLQIECCCSPALSKAVGILFSSSICSLHVSVSYFDNSCHISSIFIIICYCDQRPLRLLLQKDYNLLKSQLFQTQCYCTLNRLQCSINITFVCTGKPKFPFDSRCCDMCFIMAVWNPTGSNP